MLRRPLEYRIGRYFIVQDHRSPAVWLSLRAHDVLLDNSLRFFHDFKEDFDFTLIGYGMKQEVIQD